VRSAAACGEKTRPWTPPWARPRPFLWNTRHAEVLTWCLVNFLLRDPLLGDPEKTALAADYATVVLAPRMTATIVARVTAWAGAIAGGLERVAQEMEDAGWDHDASEKDWAAAFNNTYNEDPSADIKALVEPPVMAPPQNVPSKKGGGGSGGGGGGGGGGALAAPKAPQRKADVLLGKVVVPLPPDTVSLIINAHFVRDMSPTSALRAKRARRRQRRRGPTFPNCARCGCAGRMCCLRGAKSFCCHTWKKSLVASWRSFLGRTLLPQCSPAAGARTSRCSWTLRSASLAITQASARWITVQIHHF
jgi:hypothetical protein